MAEPKARRVTLADVAQAAGMSKSAVSMILNERPGTRLSEEAVKRVRAAAEELGYRPDPQAQSLRLGRTKSIGFISDQVTLTRYASAMISGVLDEAKAHDRTVLIAETRGDPVELERAVEAMLDRRVDGLLVGQMVARLIDVPPLPRGVPLVVVNGTTSRDHPSVLPEERTAGYTVANDYAIRDYLENYYRPNLRVKNRDGATLLGPWLVDASDVADPMSLELSTTVNGKLTQRGNTRDMILGVAQLIAHLSSILTLSPNDLILTGTPEGVVNVVVGDEVVTEIERLGRLVGYIGDDAAGPTG